MVDSLILFSAVSKMRNCRIFEVGVSGASIAKIWGFFILGLGFRIFGLGFRRSLHFGAGGSHFGAGVSGVSSFWDWGF